MAVASHLSPAHMIVHLDAIIADGGSTAGQVTRATQMKTELVGSTELDSFVDYLAAASRGASADDVKIEAYITWIQANGAHKVIEMHDQIDSEA